MAPIFIQIALAVVGLVIFAGLYFGDPGKGLRGGLVTVAIAVGAAFILSFLR
jgi:hypothetical protein